jgi:hypothetical protein
LQASVFVVAAGTGLGYLYFTAATRTAENVIFLRSVSHVNSPLLDDFFGNTSSAAFPHTPHSSIRDSVTPAVYAALVENWHKKSAMTRF